MNATNASIWTLEHVALVAADVGAWTWDLDGGLLRWSARACELLNVQRDSFGGKLGDFPALVHTGVGMSKDTRRHAFEPFFTTKPAHKGTGLGLATCHGIVTSAGGTIRIESVEGHGTTITLDLPLASEPLEERGPARSRPPTRGAASAGRLLIVEDEPAVRLVATQALRDAGFEVTGAANGEQALELCQARTFDLLVTDVILPGMSGVDLVRRARATNPRLKALLVSGYAGDIVLDHEQVLAKPYTPDSLLARIEELLARNSSSLVER